ncbi:MAG: DUF2142 domain-containing protein [Acidimicrobiales bacterium]
MWGSLSSLIRTRPVAASFSVFFVVISLWSGSVPMFGSPDETAHMVRAAGLVRGQVDGVKGADDLIRYDVPAILLPAPPCFAFKPDVTADCLSLAADDGNTMVATTASTYPPAFHLVTGLPTLVTDGLTSLYLMRLMNALVCAGLLAWSLVNCLQLAQGRVVAAAIPLALTPMVLFLSGTVNPSGVSAASGLAIWTAAFVLLEPTAQRAVGRSAAAFGVPFCLLILSRRDSLLWSAAILTVLAVLVPLPRARDLLRIRSVQTWIVLIGLTAGAHYVLWTRGNADGFDASSASTAGGNAGAAFGLAFNYFREVIGVMGWLDTRLPAIVHLVWWAGLVGLAFVALAVARGRSVAALILTVVLVIGITSWISSIRFPYFQGRYYLPLAVGAPLIAARGIGEAGFDRLRGRIIATGFGCLYLLHQVAFAQQMRRYAVGVTGPWDFAVTDHRWEPTPAPIWFFLVAYAVASAAMMLVIASMTLEPTTRPEPAASTRPNQEG